MKYIKVLYVDLNYEAFLHIQSLLQNRDSENSYELAWCNDYKIAINSILKQHYDLYLVSSDLGKWSGLDLLHEAVCSNCNDPIIMLSPDNEIYSQALEGGAFDSLSVKTLKPAALETVIRYAVEHSSTIKKLKTDGAMLRDIFERCKEPIIISNKEGEICDCNKSAIDFFKISKDQLLKTPVSTLFSDPDELKRFQQLIEGEGSVSDFETFLKAGDDTLRFCTLSSFVQITQRGSTEVYHSIIHDLTSRRNKVMEIMAKQKREVSKQLAMSLAEKIQNPLSTVNFALHEMSQNVGNDAHDLKAYIDIVKESCGRISKLTAGILSDSFITTEQIK
ncbi:PAS domain-containing protein [Pedobacter sp. HMF7647]|uniref:PAS domain-containing protein n=1 Tax=Hufsiella arboris TaxID=2695275 RepID=A0A7K1Y6I2_9SPHI|nr:PAS domain-containing protein [Hufsiella arboris]MXV49648.1 PAS domain-containing protein [Hufsiella arboris]